MVIDELHNDAAVVAYMYMYTVQCMRHARFYLLDLLHILRNSIGLHMYDFYMFWFYFYQCILAVIFTVLCIPERLQLFDSSTTSRRQSPYKEKQSRSTPQQNKKATSNWKTTF